MIVADAGRIKRVQHIVVGAADKNVAPLVARDRVVACAAFKNIVVGSTGDRVVAGHAKDPIATGSAEDRVGAVIRTLDDVVAWTGIDESAGARARQDAIVTGAAEQRVGAAVAPWASAMTDLSDGLARDLARLCAASRCGAEVRSEAIPGAGPLAWRTSFGEDYELLVSVPPEHATVLASRANMLGVPLAGIGALVPGRAVLLDGRADWPPLLFSHFGEGA